MRVYKLVSENLSGLGGMMGTEHTHNNFVKYYTSLQKAKGFAEADYEKPIVWKGMDSRAKEGYRSDDFGYVMYRIYKIEVE